MDCPLYQSAFSRETEPKGHMWRGGVCVCVYVALFLGLAHTIVRVGKCEIHRADHRADNSGGDAVLLSVDAVFCVS